MSPLQNERDREVYREGAKGRGGQEEQDLSTNWCFLSVQKERKKRPIAEPVPDGWLDRLHRWIIIKHEGSNQTMGHSWGTAVHQSADSPHRHLWIHTRSLLSHLIAETRFCWRSPLVPPPRTWQSGDGGGACPAADRCWQVSPSDLAATHNAFSESAGPRGNNGLTQTQQGRGAAEARCLLGALMPNHTMFTQALLSYLLLFCFLMFILYAQIQPVIRSLHCVMEPKSSRPRCCCFSCCCRCCCCPAALLWLNTATQWYPSSKIRRSSHTASALNAAVW